MNSDIRLHKVQFPITSLGYGNRLGIWVQGCSIRCEGCVNRDTWSLQEGSLVPIEGVLQSASLFLLKCDGVTISGGEPLDQPDAVRCLLEKLRPLVCGDILLYTGYSHAWVEASRPWIFPLVDVLITGPYDASSGQTKILRGSDNQEIFLLTNLALQRYSGDINEQLWGQQRAMDVFVDGNEVWFAGIPRPGEMEALRANLANRGVSCQTSEQ